MAVFVLTWLLKIGLYLVLLSINMKFVNESVIPVPKDIITSPLATKIFAFPYSPVGMTSMTRLFRRHKCIRLGQRCAPSCETIICRVLGGHGKSVAHSHYHHSMMNKRECTHLPVTRPESHSAGTCAISLIQRTLAVHLFMQSPLWCWGASQISPSLDQFGLVDEPALFVPHHHVCCTSHGLLL